jgi:hypothetical protein
LHQKIWSEIWRRIDVDIELTPEEASPRLKRERIDEVKKEEREMRVLNGSQEDPSAENYYK